MKKIYIAGQLAEQKERDFLEQIDKICQNLGFKTFLPHRDIGVISFKEEIEKAFTGDVKALDECNFIVSILNGDHIGAGTAWEIGYAYAQKKKIIGIKTDKKPEDSIPELSAMLIKSIDIATSIEQLKSKLKLLL